MHNWSKFDIIWFTSQLMFLLIINLIIFIDDNLTIIGGIISIVASLFGASGTWLAVKKYNMNYFFGIIHVILYGLIAFDSKVYGDFMLNIFIFLPMDIIGWITWIRITSESISCKHSNIEECNCKNRKIESKELSTNQWLLSVGVILVSTLLYAWLLAWLDDPAYLLDSTSTTLSIFGMWLMMKYYREQWWIWFIVNIVSVGIWVQVFIVTKDMQAIVFIAMWSIYTSNSIIGTKRWLNKNELKNMKKIIRTIKENNQIVNHYFTNNEIVGFEIFIDNKLYSKIETKYVGINLLNGRTQISGDTLVIDKELTNTNKKLIMEFWNNIFYQGVSTSRNDMYKYISINKYLQHNVENKIGDGLDQLIKSVEEMNKRGSDLKYDKLDICIVEGNFAFLRSLQNWLNPETKEIEIWEYYDLFRIEDNFIVEHWDILGKLQ